MASGDYFSFQKTGMSTGQALALATTVACRPCGCGTGSGGGSGSGFNSQCCYQWCQNCDADGVGTFVGPNTLTASLSVTCIGTRTLTLDKPSSGCFHSIPVLGSMYYGISGATVAGGCLRCLAPFVIDIWSDNESEMWIQCGADGGYDVSTSLWLRANLYSTTGAIFYCSRLNIVSLSPFYAIPDEQTVVCAVGHPEINVPGAATFCVDCVGQLVTGEVTE